MRRLAEVNARSVWLLGKTDPPVAESLRQAWRGEEGTGDDRQAPVRSRPSAVELLRTARQLAAELESGRDGFPERLRAEYARTLLNLRSILRTLLEGAPRGPYGLPDVVGIQWDPNDPRAGTTAGVSPFDRADEWETMLKRWQRVIRYRRKMARYDPDAVPPIRTHMPKRRPPKPCDQGRVRHVILGARRQTVGDAVRLLDNVTVEDVFAASGCRLPAGITGDLASWTDLIFYIGPGFGAFFENDGLTSEKAPIYPLFPIEAASRHRPGLYWDIGPLTFSVGGGRCVLAPPVLTKLLSDAGAQKVREWRKSSEAVLFVVSGSYWNRRHGLRRAMQRVDQAAALAFPRLDDEAKAALGRITAKDIASALASNLIGKAIPASGPLASLVDKAELASRLGMAVGMAAWGTSFGDIDAAARLIAKILSDVAAGKVAGRMVKKPNLSHAPGAGPEHAAGASGGNP